MANIREQVDKFTAAFNAHDLDALDALASDGVTMTAPGGQKRTGRAELRAWNADWQQAFPDGRIRDINCVVAGNTSVTESVLEGTHIGILKTPMGDIPPTGRNLKGPFVSISEYDDSGMVTSVRLYYDVADLMQQLGLMPAPAGAQA